MSARKPAAKPAGAKVIFNAAAVAARLGALRAKAVEDGKEDARWWEPALEFGWAAVRAAGQGTQWCNVTYTDDHNVSGWLNLRINGEKHTGTIMPLTDAGCAEMAAQIKNPKVVIKPRLGETAQFAIQKWRAQVKTEEDGITLLKDAEGNPVLPDASLISPYYQVAELVNEAWNVEVRERIDRGSAFTAHLTSCFAQAKKLKTPADPDAALQQFYEVNGPKHAGDMILSSDSVTAIRKMWPEKAAGDRLIKGATIANNMKVAELIQTNISTRSNKNAGMALPNPMARIKMEFTKETGVANMAFFDKSKPFMVDGKQKYEAAMVEDKPDVLVPINASNVHKFIRSRARADGIVSLSSVCFSSMGISMPIKAEVLVIEPATNSKVGFDDVYDDDGNCFEANPEPAPAPEAKAEAPAADAAAKAAPAVAAPAKAAWTQTPAAPAEEADYGALLDGLGVGGD
jgi:hypothetical protein